MPPSLILYAETQRILNKATMFATLRGLCGSRRFSRNIWHLSFGARMQFALGYELAHLP